VELLIVIAVIGVLAGLLLPALSRAKEQAKRIKCVNNLRQIGLGLTMYIQDTSAYPLAASYFGQARVSWDEALQTYTSSTWGSPLYTCPSYKWITTPQSVARTLDFLVYRFGSYAYNADGSALTQGRLGLGYNMEFPDDPSFSADMVVKEAAVTSPSDMIAVGDAPIWERPSSGDVGGCFTFDWQFGRIMAYNHEPSHMLRAARQRHYDRYNAVFCDAHVETISRTTLFGIEDGSTQRLNRQNRPYLIDFWNQSYEGN
jgi:prepilin-type processing-associated H-X9-DG protein